ncbi:MAG: hypothetical protein E8D45_11920 [Nitrospira sp.]|nr:MAG: hypothetical protein E8D45_11920 [Nitrospira sp.]
MRRMTIVAIFLLLQGIITSCATQEMTPPGAMPDTARGAPSVSASEYLSVATGIQLEKAVHFSAPEGDDVLAAPGHYQVEPTVEAQLRLIPEGSQPPIVIVALTSDFNVDVSAPIALTLSPREDVHHVVLLLPGGAALDGIGSYSGVKMRAPFSALGNTSVKTTLNARLTEIKSPLYKELPKEAPKFERRATDFTVQPGQRTSNYEDCTMAGSGYLGSVIAQRTEAIMTRGAPAVPTPTPQGTTTYVTTNPRTPWRRDVPKNPYHCVFGNATVIATGMLPLQAGERVQLLVTSWVTGTVYRELWIKDTYELAAQGGKSLTFPKVVVAAAYGGVDIGFVKWMDVSKQAVQRMPNGVFVGFTLKLADKRIACQYKPDPNNFGQGTVSCPPGMPWPLQQ